jgi:hypothetical protein
MRHTAFVLLSLLVWPTKPRLADVKYVECSGRNDADCDNQGSGDTRATAWTTICHAGKLARNTDTVYVSNG